MSEVAVESPIPTTVKVVESYLLTALPTQQPGSPNYERFALYKSLQGRVASIEQNPEFDRDQQTEEIAKLAADVYKGRNDPEAVARIIAQYARHTALKDILPDLRQAPNTEQRAKAYEMEQVIRDDIIKRAGLPEDLFESNHFFKPIK